MLFFLLEQAKLSYCAKPLQYLASAFCKMSFPPRGFSEVRKLLPGESSPCLPSVLSHVSSAAHLLCTCAISTVLLFSAKAVLVLSGRCSSCR